MAFYDKLYNTIIIGIFKQGTALTGEKKNDSLLEAVVDVLLRFIWSGRRESNPRLNLGRVLSSF